MTDSVGYLCSLRRSRRSVRRAAGKRLSQPVSKCESSCSAAERTWVAGLFLGLQFY